MSITLRIAAGSIALGLVVLALKSLAWWLTGSAALYSDALESVVNVAASVIALTAIMFAAKPADANHPYGHEKAEVFAAAIEGALIILAAGSILTHAWASYLAPRPIEAPWLGLALNGVATLCNGAWAGVLLRVGRRKRSVALLGDARHLLADVATSVGVTIGVAAAVLTGVLVLDPLLAAATAVHVVLSGWHLLAESVGGLMDAAPADDVVDQIRALVREHATGAIEAHDLRYRGSGKMTFIEFHLVVPGQMRVDEAHVICDRVESALKAAMPDVLITIHVEPDGKAKHKGVLVL